MSRNDITGDEIKTRAATEQYRQNHQAIFGNKKIQRGRWVQDPVTGELVDPNEYRRPESSKIDIFVDNFEAYDSPITGEIINNRRKRDYDLKASGSRPYEGFKVEKQEAERFNSTQERQFSKNIHETVHRTMYEIQHGYRTVK